MASALLKILGHVQNYHWGKKADSSLIAKFLSNPEKNTKLAELWFGAHERAPSMIEGQNLDLRQAISKDTNGILGKETADLYQNEFPFLLKILSIEKALSIQLHPDRINAAILHAKDPKNYPDANHKPEIAVALSEAHALYGFRPIAEIKKVLRKNPEFELFIPEKAFSEIQADREKNNPKGFISKLYAGIIHADKIKYEHAAKTLVARLSTYTKLNRHEKLILEVIAEYGYQDLAVFTVLLMNYCVLLPGQAIFTAPNTLHAYLKGDLLECMANSDNVMRAGMTPKFQDLKEIEKILDFKMSSAKTLNPAVTNGALETQKYPVDCSEFDLSLLKGTGVQKFNNKKNSVNLFLCIEGSARLQSSGQTVDLKIGEACLAPASQIEFSFEAQKAVVARVTQ